VGRKIEFIILTEDFSKKCIKNIHNNIYLYYFHIGIRQLQNKIKPFYIAKHLTQNINTICRNCEVCIKNKSRGQYKFGLVSHLGLATKPF